MTAAHPDHIGLLAAELRDALIEERRALAVAGTGDPPPLPDAIGVLVADHAALLSAPVRERVADRVLRDTVGLGPLEELLRDPEVEEVLVNGHDEVWVERRGRLIRTEVAFPGEDGLRDVIERVLGPIGRRVDELSPMADGRLPDGSRVNVIIPPLSVDGPAVSIRRFAGIRPDPAELLARGSFDERLLELLRTAVESRQNLIISGGTGSGKTTVLNALSSFIDPGERVITIEDAAELSLIQPHVVRLESRPAGDRGVGGGDDPRPRAQRAAHAARSDRDRRGPGRRGDGSSRRAEHRPSRCPVDRARQRRRGRAAADRDAGDDGRPRRSPRGDPRSTRPRRSTSSCTWSGRPAARGTRRSSRRSSGWRGCRPSASSGSAKRGSMTACRRSRSCSRRSAALPSSSRPANGSPRCRPCWATWRRRRARSPSPVARTGRRPSGSVAGSASSPAPCSGSWPSS